MHCILNELNRLVLEKYLKVNYLQTSMFIKLGPPMSSAFFFPLNQRGYEIGSPLIPASIAASLTLPAIFWVKIMYRCDFLFISS